MSAGESAERLSAFSESGVFRLDQANALFIDPVRILNRSYTRFRISPRTYYSRFFSEPKSPEENAGCTPGVSRKRKKRPKEMKKERILNSREQIAEQRHRNVRLALLKAHEALLDANRDFGILRILMNAGGDGPDESPFPREGLDFVELASAVQAPLFEIALNVYEDERTAGNSGCDSCNPKVVPVFNSLVANECSIDVEAEFLDRKYVLPKRSCFYMSDLQDIHSLVPADSDYGFNLVVIDPPWENSSAHQKMRYQTLPNRHFLYLPVKQLVHTHGALVALWVTNREKLREFVENELFPKWNTKHVATMYWLKVKPEDGSLISEMDLFHHRPYECLLLGFCLGKEGNSEEVPRLDIPDNQIFISVPGDYSRKPPIGEVLMDYLPRCRRARCIELFSREMIPGWTSWGNEPLHFQDSKYFVRSSC